MNLKNKQLTFIIFLLFFSPTVNAQKFNYIETANQWLNLVDSEKYSQSWSNTDLFCKRKINRELWIDLLSITRAPLGKPISRKVISSKEYTKIHVLQFETLFQNRINTSIENLTFCNSNGQWTVIGYFIKQKS